MVHKSINQLQLWNTSKQVASTAYDVHTGEKTFIEFRNSHDPGFIPFTDKEELRATIEEIDGNTRKQVVEQLQRDIHNTLKKDFTFEIDTTNIDLTGLQLSNRARSAAKHLLNHIEELESGKSLVESNSDAYEMLLEEHEGLLPKSETKAFEIVDSVAGDTRQETFNAVTRELIALVKESETDENVEEQPVEVTDQAREIAEDLATLFIDRDYSKYDSYFDITDGYDGVVFPSRDVSMMKVVNATGDTRDDRVESIVEWVTTWLSNPEHAKELSARRRAPMGMSGRSD